MRALKECVSSQPRWDCLSTNKPNSSDYRSCRCKHCCYCKTRTSQRYSSQHILTIDDTFFAEIQPKALEAPAASAKSALSAQELEDIPWDHSIATGKPVFVPQGSESAVPNLKKKAAEKTKPAASAPAAKEVKPQPKASEAEPFPPEIAGVPKKNNIYGQRE